ncbi:MAG: hypothetical protein JEZ12_20985 [Desulfobacterium sp.]|nr:hypothetical protein [Desulfobacterium sp.]
MVDFIIRNHQPVLIEMPPRPGGDCLPFLLLEAVDLDIIRLALDFYEFFERINLFDVIESLLIAGSPEKYKTV